MLQQNQKQQRQAQKPAAVTLDKVYASYSGKPGNTITNLSLTVPRGIIQFIIGPNGAGKTTLIKVLNGLVKPSKGKITILGKSIEDYKNQREFRIKLGYIPQNLGLVKMETVMDNVLMGALPRLSFFQSLFKLFPDNELEFAMHLLESLELQDKADKTVYCLSGGEKRRVAIARALMQKPEILLADEILSDLDFKIALDIMNKIKKLKK